MRERVADAGGDLTVRSAPGEGTTLAAVVPSA
jgi:signal transduction histidine kinase